MKDAIRLKDTVLLLLLLSPGWLLAPGLSAAIPSVEPSSASRDFNFLPPRLVSADFDGDHQADIASGLYQGQTYRVEINFSTGKSPVSITFPAAYPEFNIFALDIDGDSDQDLVIVSGSSLSPPAVWLNNGAGHFDHSGRWWWASLFSSDNSPWFDSNGPQRDPAFASQDHRSLFQFSDAHRGATLEVHQLVPRESPTY